MLRNYISFNNLVARISECRKRMTIVRSELQLREESGQDTEHFKKELSILRNQIYQLQQNIRNLQKNQRINLFSQYPGVR